MTDKKKRGRPPGSKGKSKVEPFNSSKLDQDVDTDVVEEKNVAENISKALVRHFGDGPNVTPFPSNWNDLSKIDKLQWLTANRK